MFNNFDEAQIQFSNSGAFLLFYALNEQFNEDGFEENLEAFNSALIDCTDAGDWMIQYGHERSLSSALEALEAMTWFMTPKTDRREHAEWCHAQIDSWIKTAKEQREAAEKKTPLQSKETQKIAAKLNELLTM